MATNLSQRSNLLLSSIFIIGDAASHTFFVHYNRQALGSIEIFMTSLRGGNAYFLCIAPSSTDGSQVFKIAHQIWGPLMFYGVPPMYLHLICIVDCIERRSELTNDWRTCKYIYHAVPNQRPYQSDYHGCSSWMSCLFSLFSFSKAIFNIACRSTPVQHRIPQVLLDHVCIVDCWVCTLLILPCNSIHQRHTNQSTKLLSIYYFNL